MKIISLLLFFLSANALAVCSSPISRTNNTANQVLTSTKYNLDLNTVYSRVNSLPGDCIVDDSITTDKIADGAVTSDKLASGLLAQFIPAGTILPYGGSVAPTGFLLCNGQTVSRTTYADLYAVISTSFGAGNGSTTFHVPDLRGRFLRGYDGGAGRDPDAATRTAMNSGGATADNIGSVQDDEFKSHTHNVAGNGADNSGSVAVRLTLIAANTSITNAAQARGGNETRPKNANVNFIIKY
jgi:microcystin-dependent protein